MSDKDKNLSSQEEIEAQAMTAKEMRSLADAKPKFLLLDKEFSIYQEVFNPEIGLEQTEFLNEAILKVIREEVHKLDQEYFDFLEIGCGAGYTSVLVALISNKCRVIGTDINETAILNTLENAKHLGAENQVKSFVSDVYNSKELEGKKFDIIYWNIPWAGQFTESCPEGDLLLQGLIDPGYRCFRRYLSEAGIYLKDSGRLLVAFSFNMGSELLFKQMTKETGWDYEIIARKDFPFEIDGGICTKHLDVSLVELFKKK